MQVVQSCIFAHEYCDCQQHIYRCIFMCKIIRGYGVSAAISGWPILPSPVVQCEGLGFSVRSARPGYSLGVSHAPPDIPPQADHTPSSALPRPGVSLAQTHMLLRDGPTERPRCNRIPCISNVAAWLPVPYRRLQAAPSSAHRCAWRNRTAPISSPSRWMNAYAYITHACARRAASRALLRHGRGLVAGVEF